MEESTRKSLLLTLRMTIGMLPRYLRHDHWRTCEPQHGHAVDRIAETIAAKVEAGFEVKSRPPREARSVADRIQWTKEST
jgi:hypothetical protein